jgi:2-phospho-L-lactate guanylyltransferase
MHAGLLPVKRTQHAKQRLAPGFSEQERTEIARALLSDALGLCRSASLVRWWVVSADDDVARQARDLGLGVIEDRVDDLNGALAHAIGVARAAGADSVTVLPADIPLARVEDVQDLLDTGATSDVVVVPARRGGGTNALHLAPPEILSPRFGPGSLSAHVEAAGRSGLRCSILELPRVALDIDTLEDVDDLLAAPRSRGGQTAAVLARLRAGHAAGGATH